MDIINRLIFLSVVPYQCTYEAISNTGLKRQVNEDNYFVAQQYKGSEEGKQKLTTLVVVADGMGGSIGGQLASTKAVEKISTMFESLQILPEHKKVKELLEEWVLSAHNLLVNIAMEDASNAGMGTTITVLLIIDDKAHIAWVGDSRLYIYRHKGKKIDKITDYKRLKLVTKDHSFVWEQIDQGIVTLDAAETLDFSHIITHSLGSIKNQPYIEYKQVRIKNSDKLMVCTDGVNLHLKTNEILTFLSKIKDSGLNIIGKEMEELIMDRGADDNFTFVLLDYALIGDKIQKNRKFPFKDFLKSSRKELILGFLLSAFLIILFNRLQSSDKEETINETNYFESDSLIDERIQNNSSSIIDSLSQESSKQLSMLLDYDSKEDSYLLLVDDYNLFISSIDSINNNLFESHIESQIIDDYSLKLKYLENQLNEELLKLNENDEI